MPRSGRRQHRRAHTPERIRFHARPLHRARDGGQALDPLARAEQEYAALAGAARCREGNVFPAEQAATVRLIQEGLDFFQPDRAIGDQVVEVLHECGLREDWQLFQQLVLKAAVEALVERRSLKGELTQLANLPRLMHSELGGRP